MFERVRLRIAGLYVLLLALIVVLVAGSLVLLAARDTRQTADLELRLRAEGLAAAVLRDVGSTPQGRYSDDEDEEEHHGSLEQAGFLTYVWPVVGETLATIPAGGIAGLPDAAGARDALAAHSGRYTTLSLPQGRVRVYSLPVERGRTPIAVVQVVRTQSFVESTVRRLLIGLAVSGFAGLVAASLTGYWLAGRTLRPIAEAMQRQQNFVADASHELRTPLAVIRGNLDHMRSHPERPVGAYDDVMEDLLAESDRLGRLVTGLLALVRVDEGNVRLEPSRIDFSALVHGLVREMAPLADEKGLELHTAIATGITIEGDADRLHELGLILLDNAIRYTQAGAVSLGLTADDHGALLSVSDTGPGIATEHLPRIFDRFYRTPSARSSEVDGTGLGLAIARWIAEAHGGRITVASEIGRGSTFTVRLPRRGR
jgi:two-component system sensor histidine kinase CiaH